MINVQLYIEGQEVELFQNESISIKQTIQDVRDVGKIFTDFTKTFEVPASKENNKIFQHFYNFSVIGYDTRKKKEAEIYLNHQFFRKGKVAFESAKMQNGNPISYSLTFYGLIVNLKDFLGEDKIDALTDLKDIVIDYTSTEVGNLLSDAKDKYVGTEYVDGAILFPLITHTDQVFYNSTTQVDESLNLFPATNAGVVHGPFFTQFKPAIRLYAIIKAIEQHYSTANGFPANIKFASGGFFDNTNADFYDLYMWLHRKKGERFEDSEQQFANFFINPDSGEPELTRDKFTASAFNLIEHSDRREFFINIVSRSDISGYNVIVKRDGEEFMRVDNIDSGRQEIITALKGFGGVPSDRMGEGSYEIFLENAVPLVVNLEVTIKKRRPATFPEIGTQVRTASYEAVASIFATEKLTAKNELPELKVYDFLTGLFKMFNLTAFVNRNDEIVVKSLDQFYEDSDTTWDITEFVDGSRMTIEPLTVYKSIILRYQGLDQKLAVNHQQISNKEWGTATYKGGDQGSKTSEGNDYKIELPFEHFKFTRLFDGASSSLTDIQVGFSVDEDDSAYKGKPLLFYPIKITGGTEISIRTSGDQNFTKTSYYIPSNTKSLTDSQTIHFDAELSEYQNQTFTQSLFDSFYRTYISDIFKTNRRLHKLEAFLPLRVLLNLELNNRVIISGNLYKINSIQTNFQTEKSKLELINEVKEFLLVDNIADLARTVDKPFVKVDSTEVTVDVDTISV
jgi:hypothetical protein